jgi:urea transport system ATP-binding protein
MPARPPGGEGALGEVNDREILAVRDLTVRFGGLCALDGVTLDVRSGQVLGIIGPNGAGKSTLFAAISGLLAPTSGRVIFARRDIAGLPPHEITRLGIGRKFQVPNVFESLTVRRNLAVAFRGRMPLAALLETSASPRAAEIDGVLARLRLDAKAEQEAGALSHGERQWLEIGMLLVNGATLLLLDEPTAGMTMQETKRTEELLRALATDRTIAVIEHDIRFIREVAQRVIVMHMGRILTAGSIDEVVADPIVRDVYLGRPT